MVLDLDQARRRAKELLRSARAGDPDALARMRDDRAPRLADAQRAVAANLGFTSWPALVGHVEASRGDRAERRARLVAAALGGRADVAERLLEHDPALAGTELDVALVLGDERIVGAALDRDPGLVARDLPGPGRKPLSCACHSVFLRPSSPRAPGVRRVIELLLDRGADVNEVHHNEYGAMSVLYGAAGVAHDLEATRLLLDRGANPDDGESVYHAVEAEDSAADEVAVLLEEAAARAGVVRSTGLEYLPGRPIRVSVRRRGIRYDIDDLGGAVAIAGRPPGWFETAERVVAERGWNISRDGVVFVQVVEGRDIDALVRRTGEASAAVLEALVALAE